MACTPLNIPSGLFYTNTTWKNVSESRPSGKSVTYAPDGTFTIAGPNGSMRFTPTANELLRHMFFGSKDYLAVLRTEKAGLVSRRVLLIDFTVRPITAREVLVVSVLATALFPWLQYSGGAGDVCCVGSPSTDFGVKGLKICRSDNGTTLLMGPADYRPRSGTYGTATTTMLQIVDGTQVLAQTPLPAGRLEVIPASQTFPAVSIGGPGTATSSRQFTLKNTGTDCLHIEGISRSDPFAVTAQSVPLPADLASGQTMTITVTFAPTAAGTWTSRTLPITRTPALGADKLTCSGTATMHDTVAPVWPSGAVLTADGVTINSAVLHWPAAQDDRGVAGYRVYRDATLITSPGALTLQYAVTGLAPDTDYAFRVEAVDMAGNQSANGPANRVHTAPLPPPPAVDQTNDTAWTGGATNIVPANRVRQVVVPSRPRLRAVEVALMTGNPGYGGDQVTLTVLAVDGAVLVKTSAAIPQGFDGFWRFELPGSGTAVIPDEPLTLLLEDTGRNAFWWKYTGGNPYPAGPAYFGDNIFGDNDFLFRTYGSS
jgi:fibronectin type III domain protein